MDSKAFQRMETSDPDNLYALPLAVMNMYSFQWWVLKKIATASVVY